MTSLGNKLNADWPFAAGKQPYFYGWVIAVVSTLGFLMSIPGQTMGMAVFADEFIAAFDLSRTELATAYLIGTMGSAFFLTRAGRWYDMLGARVLMVAASLGLAVTLLIIGVVDWVSSQLAVVSGLDLSVFSFVLITLCYFGVRFTGQGVLTSASRNVLLVWFERRRGLVSGVRGVFVSLGFSIAPIVLALLIDTFGWRGGLWVMAAAVGLGFGAIALLMVRDSPSVCGLKVDGLRSDSTDQAVDEVQPSQGLAEVRRNPVFWMYSLALSMHAMFGTAVTFHIAAIFAEVGRSRTEAFAYFVPSAIVSVCVNLSASALSDYTRLKPFLVVMLCAFLLGAYGLATLEQTSGYWMLVLGFGAGGGLWGVLSNLVFVRQFGILHLGEISGLNTSITVLSSAIGPVVFSLANDFVGDFRSAALACMVPLAGLLVASVLLQQPLDKKPNSQTA
ncbi:MAG: MFS transporter [Pseudomonadales bacterium]|jgi:MFS transporter, OFA family, oxalate/formate antiporter|nr:MFS transporter [Pseudomonadales bacterium]